MGRSDDTCRDCREFGNQCTCAPNIPEMRRVGMALLMERDRLREQLAAAQKELADARAERDLYLATSRRNGEERNAALERAEKAEWGERNANALSDNLDARINALNDTCDMLREDASEANKGMDRWKKERLVAIAERDAAIARAERAEALLEHYSDDAADAICKAAAQRDACLDVLVKVEAIKTQGHVWDARDAARAILRRMGRLT